MLDVYTCSIGGGSADRMVGDRVARVAVSNLQVFESNSQMLNYY